MEPSAAPRLHCCTCWPRCVRRSPNGRYRSLRGPKARSYREQKPWELLQKSFHFLARFNNWVTPAPVPRPEPGSDGRHFWQVCFAEVYKRLGILGDYDGAFAASVAML